MSNKDRIVAAFSSKDRKKLWIPENIAAMQDISCQKVISWMHKSGHLGYVVIHRHNHFSGIILKSTPLTGNAKVCMCDWCLSVYNSSKVSSFSYRKSPTLTVSHLICSDLNCAQRILSSDTNNVHSMRETLSKESRITRYYDNIERYWQDHVTRN